MFRSHSSHAGSGSVIQYKERGDPDRVLDENIATTLVDFML